MNSTYQSTASAPTAPRAPARGGGRHGAVAGLVVSSLFATIAVGVLALMGMGLTEAVAVIAGPTILSGTITGMVLGPTAKRRTTGMDRVALSVMFAVCATAIGDLAVGFLLGLSSSPMGELGILGVIGQAAASALVLWPIGLVIFGIVALPITFVAGLAWTWLLPRVAPRGDVTSR